MFCIEVSSGNLSSRKFGEFWTRCLKQFWLFIVFSAGNSRLDSFGQFSKEYSNTMELEIADKFGISKAVSSLHP